MALIFDQLVDVAKYHIVKLINTGDRVQDNALIVIAGSCLVIGSSWVKSLGSAVVGRVRNRFFSEHPPQTDGPITDEDRERFKAITIEKASHHLLVSDRRLLGQLLDWVESQYRTSYPRPASQRTAATSWSSMCSAHVDSTTTSEITSAQQPSRCKPSAKRAKIEYSTPRTRESYHMDKAIRLYNMFAVWQHDGHCVFLTGHEDREDGASYMLIRSTNSNAAMRFASMFEDPTSDQLAAEKAAAEAIVRAAAEAAEAARETTIDGQKLQKNTTAIVRVPVQLRQYLLPAPRTVSTVQRYSACMMKILECGKLPSHKTCSLLNNRWSLDAMIFSDKPKLESLIVDFERSAASNDPYGCRKIGVIVAGEFGTGKSSLLPALSHRLNKNVARWDVSINSDREEVRKAFFLAISLGFIISLDEIDLLFDRMSDQQLMVASQQRERDLLAAKELMNALENVDSEKFEQARTTYISLVTARNKDPVDLAFIQSLLDGIDDTSGRVIVASTNFPHRIPAALLRPGRFDVQSHMRKYTDIQIRQLLRLMFLWPNSTSGEDSNSDSDDNDEDGDEEMEPVVSANNGSIGDSQSTNLLAVEGQNDDDEPGLETSITHRLAPTSPATCTLRDRLIKFCKYSSEQADVAAWLEEIPFPSHVWSPAQVVCARQTHRTLAATAKYLSEQRPENFCQSMFVTPASPSHSEPRSSCGSASPDSIARTHSPCDDNSTTTTTTTATGDVGEPTSASARTIAVSSDNGVITAPAGHSAICGVKRGSACLDTHD